MMRQVQHTWNSDMHKKGRGVILALVMTFALSSSAVSSLQARSKAIGATFSYTGIAVSYERATDHENSFLDMALKAEFSEFTAGRSSYPGISASLTWNSILKRWVTHEGVGINLYLGPGVVIGYGKDYKGSETAASGLSSDGMFFGIMGRAGVECIFSRNINLTAGFTPVIGSHIIFNNGMVSMKWYRNGLYYALVPEIGIKYRF